MSNDRAAVVYEFDDVKIECRNFQILKSGATRRITPRAFEVLLYLIENAGRVVTKDELFETIWKENFVSDTALTRRIKEIRQVIGDDADAPRYIETVPKRGYRFIAASAAHESKQAAPPVPENRFSSIAVLPLTTSGGDPNNEYLSEGITESLINNLSKLSFLRVVPRSTIFYLQNQEMEPLSIGERLNVRAVLTGRVAQRGDTIVVSAELTDVARQSQIWGEQYQRPLADIFDLQAEISEKIFGELQFKLNPEEKERLARKPTRDLEAYQLYLKGRYFWNRRPQGLTKGLEYFERALARDPDFALAYAGIADVYNSNAYWENTMKMPPSVVMPRARAAAEKAIAIDPTLAEAYVSLSNVKLHYDWDLRSAEDCFKRALALSANYAHAHHLFSHLCLIRGQVGRSLEASRQALALDPLEISINSHLVWHYVMARQPDEALAQTEKTAELFPNEALSFIFGGAAYELKGDYEAAIRTFQKAERLSGGASVTKAALGHALARAGKIDAAREIAEELERRRSEKFVSPHDIATVYAGLGETESALRWLERAVDERSGRVIYLGIDPRWDELRRVTKFSELIGRIGVSNI